MVFGEHTPVRCMLQFHAHLISQLLYYQSEITQLALLYTFRQWYDYDWDFRMRIATNTITRWDYYDTELRSRHLVAPMTQQQHSYSCWLCGKAGHLSSHCPNKARSSSSHQSAVSDSRPPFLAPQRENIIPNRSANIHSPNSRACNYWNQERGCSNPNCKFQHICSKCQQSDHGRPHSRHR